MVTTTNPVTDWPDTPMEEIQMCLNCPRPKCIDCLNSRFKGRCSAGYKSVDAEKFIELYNSGTGIYAMAEQLSMDYRAVKTRLDMLRAPYRPGRKRIHLTIDDLECLPEYMQHRFTLKGEQM